MEGRVRVFDPEQGCGIVDTLDRGSFFVHRTAVRDRAPLLPQELVRFRPWERFALDVERVENVVVRAGECRTRTGWRVWVPKIERLALWQHMMGPRPERGTRILIRRDAHILFATWRGRGAIFDLFVVRGDFLPEVFQAFVVPVAPTEVLSVRKEFDAALDWLRQGAEGRQESYYPDVTD